MNEMTAVRNISTITAEIRTIQQNVQMYASAAAMQIGERLTEAKELMPYGEWGKWLDSEFGWTERKAQQLMQVYREFGGAQKSLFGAEITNAKTFSDLSFSKLLLLVSVPESEREAFVEENNVSEISVREMKKLIAEKESAEARAETAEKEKAEAQNRIEKQSGELSTLRRENKELRERPVETVTVVQKDEKAIADAVSAAKKEAEAEIERIKKKLKTAVEKAEKAEEKARKAAETPIAAAAALPPEGEAELTEARREAEELRARLAEAENRLKTSDADTAIFKLLFDDAQKIFAKLKEIQTRVIERDAEQGQKLRNALNALCEHLKGE